MCARACACACLVYNNNLLGDRQHVQSARDRQSFGTAKVTRRLAMHKNRAAIVHRWDRLGRAAESPIRDSDGIGPWGAVGSGWWEGSRSWRRSCCGTRAGRARRGTCTRLGSSCTRVCNETHARTHAHTFTSEGEREREGSKGTERYLSLSSCLSQTVSLTTIYFSFCLSLSQSMSICSAPSLTVGA